jgi:hypothetical protein
MQVRTGSSLPLPSAPEMKRKLDESDHHVDVGLSQATSIAVSSSSQRYGSGLTLDFDVDDCDFADSAPDSDEETLLDEHFAKVLIHCALSWNRWTCNVWRAHGLRLW